MAMKTSRTFGELLRQYRTAAGLTQEELAEQARISARAISDLERGVNRTARRDTIRQLVDALGLSQDEATLLEEAQQGHDHRKEYALSPGESVPALRTFLIADVRGYTQFTVEHGDEAAARLTTRFADVVEEVVALRQGRVVEVRGDEALIAFSSVRQALRAAVELQSRFAQEEESDPSLPLKVGMGLDAGEAIPVQNGYRGRALNVAARLCSLARAGEILVSEAVAHLAGKTDGVVSMDRGQVQLKGLPGPVRVIQIAVTPQGQPEIERLNNAACTINPSTSATPFDSYEAGDQEPSKQLAQGDAHPTTASSPIGMGKTEVAAPVPSSVGRGDGEAAQAWPQVLPVAGFLGALPSGPLVDRHRELDTVLSMVDAVVGGQGQALFLAGEPGAGKTRLGQEVTVHLKDRGFLIAAGRCYEPQQAVAYYPFLEILASAYASAPPAVRANASRRWPYLGLLLPEQLGTQSLPSSAHADEKLQLFQAVAGFFASITETIPVALLLDDLHWADNATVDLLQHLVRRTCTARLFLLGTYRDVEVQLHHPLRKALRDLNREHLVEQLLVRRLGQEDTAALMAVRLGERDVPADLAELVHRYTDGNPFFTEEVVRALIERGDVYRENHHWRRRAIEEIEVPESIRDAIGERAERLGDEAQEVLREASVLGQTFDFEDLQRMVERPEEQVEEALEKAMLAGLIREQGKEGYAFNHALTQQALYSDLTARRRRRLHLAAGAVLERRFGPGRKRRAAELAWHFLEANDTERALQYTLVAADEAFTVGAYAESRQHACTAVELARQIGDEEQELEALEWLQKCLYTLCQYREELDIANQALARAERKGDAAQVAKWLNAIGRVCIDLGELEQAKRHLDRGVGLVEDAGDDKALEEVLNTLGLVLFYLGEWESARSYLEIALSKCGSLPPDYKGWVHVDLAKISLAEGKWEEAADHLRDACATDEHHLWALVYAQWLLAKLDLLGGDPDAAMRRLMPVRDDPHLSTEDLVEVLPILAEIYLALGDESNAGRVAERAVQQARDQQHQIALLEALLVNIMVLVQQERWDESRELVEEAVQGARDIHHPYAEARALYWSSVIRTPHDDPGQAHERLREALAIFRRLGAQKDVERVERALPRLVSAS